MPRICQDAAARLMEELSFDTASHVLVRHAQAHVKDAIAILYEHYRDRLRLALRKKLGDRHRIMKEIRSLIVRMATDNPTVGSRLR